MMLKPCGSWILAPVGPVIPHLFVSELFMEQHSADGITDYINLQRASAHELCHELDPNSFTVVRGFFVLTHINLHACMHQQISMQAHTHTHM